MAKSRYRKEREIGVIRRLLECDLIAELGNLTPKGNWVRPKVEKLGHFYVF